ncbi:MAG: isoleucine--tRNA ligase [Elusimicrobia bacterium]|nr:isoleucine--tRNA ligase [Elusimicrobiota bacterium]
MPETRTDWSATVRLPKTDFPMKGDLAQREPELLKVWYEMGLYERLQERQKGRPPFILHDGPPYANGHIHIGHAQGSILKDATMKARALMGHATPYVPGWDCHGLPIETALLKELKMSKRGVTDVPKFRAAAAAFAQRFIDLQREEFKRLGVLGDWSHPYTTMSKSYEAAILRAFRLLVKQGHVYRGLKPVQWCITCETALAEAEVEYKDKTSPSVYVALPVVEGELKGAEIVVWTTTPWTLPANRAAAFQPALEYAEVSASVGGRTRRLIVARARFESVMAEIGAQGAKIIRSWPGEKIVALANRYILPYEAKPGEVGVSVLAEYVTADDGTGIVHTAPGHGEDDFHTGRRYDLEILNPVDASGHFTDKAPRWKGKHIFKDGNPEIVADLAERGLLLAKKDIAHSYPHCWRCKNPVVFRTTEQWFLRLSDDLRERLLAQIDLTQWVPPESRNRIAAMVGNRPDWCLSRQRVWGAPIAVLYSVQTGQPVLDDAVLEAIEKKASADGAEFWFERWGETLSRQDWPFLPDHPALQSGFRRETDILDVWLDSGVSWLSVLGSEVVADLYLEGTDQHRGWFQSSLVMSTALRGRAPYKAVLTHGFVMDGQGRAMHKSAGNVVAPEQIISKWGADVLRLWVVLSDMHEDTRISDKILEGPADSYRRVRNTLRFLLGNLADFKPEDAVAFEHLPEMERYVLHRLAELQTKTLEDYREYRYRDAARRLVDFCAFDLSAFYLDVTKDRMYTYREDAPERRAAQTVMAETLSRLCALLAPILSFTAEEAWRFWAARPAESVFLWDLPALDARWTAAALATRWQKVLASRAVAQKALEEARAAKTIGSSLQAKVSLRATAADLEALDGLNLPELLIVSEAALENGSGEISAAVTAAAGAKCPRCWRWQTDVGADQSFPELCGRCARQLS